MRISSHGERGLAGTEIVEGVEGDELGPDGTSLFSFQPSDQTIPLKAIHVARGLCDPATIPTEVLQLLRPDGTLAEDPDWPIDLKEGDLRNIYRFMILVRRLDQEATNLQRQGELALHLPLLGQEAAQVGSAYALEPKDWIFTYGREHAVALVRGVDPADIMHLWRGTWHGGMWDPRAHNMAPYCIPVATQIPHAVGFALGAKLDRSDVVTIVYFGDGATSEGDFHEGCNFAGVWRAPVVFFCQNNQYALSVPLAQQTAAPSIAAKALGYGFPGVRVDGNDVLAVHAVTKAALRRARKGDGPTLIEAVTYRRGPHSTADDPKRYQPPEEVARWEMLDPLARVNVYLDRERLLPDDFAATCEAEANVAAAKLRADIVGASPRPGEELFDFVYSERPPALERQLAEFRRMEQWRQ